MPLYPSLCTGAVPPLPPIQETQRKANKAKETPPPAEGDSHQTSPRS
jgi:hypothetical protein